MSITPFSGSNQAPAIPEPVQRVVQEPAPAVVRPRLDGYNPNYNVGLTVSVTSPDRSVEASISVGMLLDIYV